MIIIGIETYIAKAQTGYLYPTHRQGRHLPRAPDFKGPLNSIMCLKSL